MSNELNTAANDVLTTLSLRSEPLAASTADGRLRDAGGDLRERLAAVRAAAPVADSGSCSFTGWGS